MQSQVTAPSNINALSINERRRDILICAELFIHINKTHLNLSASTKSMRCAVPMATLMVCLKMLKQPFRKYKYA